MPKTNSTARTRSIADHALDSHTVPTSGGKKLSSGAALVSSTIVHTIRNIPTSGRTLLSSHKLAFAASLTPAPSSGRHLDPASGTDSVVANWQTAIRQIQALHSVLLRMAHSADMPPATPRRNST